MRLRFLHPKPGAEPVAPRRRAAAPVGDEAVAAARLRARRRLVGALVLLAIGVIGFPVLFETQPRPLPLDTPIETPARDAAAMQPRVALPPKPAPLPVVPADAGTEMVAATPAPAASAPAAPAAVPSAPVRVVAPAPRASAPVVVAVTPPAPAPAATATPVTAPVTAPAAAPPKPVPAATPAASAAGAGRYVVQVGAYTDPATLREARAKVEKLGLKTYTQVIEGEGKPRTRVRLGPYATREEADAAAAKVKRAGLPANILTL